MQCPQCQAQNDAGLRFCESCGAKLARLCPYCGHELKPQAQFCGSCGWPTAREDDPERAVCAGLAIVDALVPLNATLAAGDGTRLAVRIGMHTGPVVIADGGEVFGETANVAARVQGAAEPDTVVITAATQRLVAGLFVVEERGALDSRL